MHAARMLCRLQLPNHSFVNLQNLDPYKGIGVAITLLNFSKVLILTVK